MLCQAARAAICICFLLSAEAALGQTSSPTYIEFDAPGASTAAGQGTFVTAINSAGAIAGQYIDTFSAFHGFVLDTNGTKITFDVPGAGAGAFRGTASTRRDPLLDPTLTPPV